MAVLKVEMLVENWVEWKVEMLADYSVVMKVVMKVE